MSKQDNDHIDTFVKIIQNLGFEQTGFSKMTLKEKMLSYMIHY